MALMMAGIAAVVRSLTHRESGLGGDEQVRALLAERLPDDVLRRTGGVDISRVEHVDPSIDADGDLAC